MTPIAVTISGITPLLCGRPSTATPDHRTPEEQASLKLYRGSDGWPIIPGLNLFRCLAGAASSIQRSAVEVVHALGISQSVLPIDAPAGWLVDTRIVRDRTTGMRVLCHRPRFDVWRLSALLQVDDDLLPLTQARALVDAAGDRVGLGDFRPDRGGPFGRFVVTRWDWS